MRKGWLKTGLLALLVAVFVWLNVSAVTPADASTLKDGNYAIPATLVKSDGKTSAAAQFFAPTAQVTVTSGQARVTLAMQNGAEKFIKSVTVAGQDAVSGSALTVTLDSAKAELPVTFSLQIPTLGAMTQSAMIDLDWSGVPTVTAPVTPPTVTPTVTAESDSSTATSTPAVVTPTATQTTKTTKTTKTVTKPKLTVKAIKAKAKTVKGTATAGAKVRVKQRQKTLGTATATKKGTFTVKLKRAVKAKAKLTVTATKAKATTKQTVTVKAKKATTKQTTTKKTKKAAKAFTVKTPTGTWRAAGKKQYAQVWTFSQKTGLTQKLYRHNKKVKTLVAYATYHVTPKTTTFWKVTYAPRHAKTKTMYLRFTSPKHFKVVNAHNHVVKTAVAAAPATTWTFNKR